MTDEYDYVRSEVGETLSHYGYEDLEYGKNDKGDYYELTVKAKKYKDGGNDE